jgi:DNA-binding transcriptional LysR family regulator
LFGDPLFTRHARGLAATARASSSGPKAPLATPERFSLTQTFDPSNARLNLTFGAAEDVELLLLPELMAELRQKAPDARFDVQPTDWQVVDDDLLRGKFDIAFTIAPDGPAGIRRESLMVTGFSCLYDPVEVTPPDPPELVPWIRACDCHFLRCKADFHQRLFPQYRAPAPQGRFDAQHPRHAILCRRKQGGGDNADTARHALCRTIRSGDHPPATGCVADRLFDALAPRRAADRSFQWVLDEIRRWALLREGQTTA